MKQVFVLSLLIFSMLRGPLFSSQDMELFSFSEPMRDSKLSHCSPCSETNLKSFTLFGEVLYWFASEENANIWTIFVPEISFPAPSLISESFAIRIVPFDWDLGFRIGADWNIGYGGWDMQFYYTWFRTQGKDAVPEADQRMMFSEFFCANSNADIYRSASTKTDLFYSMFDVDLGCGRRVSKTLSFRPFIGLKGGWINHQFILSGHTTRSTLASEVATNNFYGIGPTGGINTQWVLGRTKKQCFSLFGDLAGAFMWGNWDFSDRYESSISQFLELKMPNSSLGSLMLRSFFGIGWDHTLPNDRFHFAFKVGYEMEFWFNQLRLPTYYNYRLHHDLTLQGGTFDFRLDF